MFKHEPFEFSKLEAVTDEATGKRVYRTPDGQNYPSVTTMLGSLKKEVIREWQKKVGYEEAQRIRIKSANKGKAIHKIAETYLKNEIYQFTNPFHMSLFHDLKIILDDHISTIYNQEFSVYSDNLKIAGTGDLLANWDERITYIDFKTSEKEKKEEWILNYFLQATLYCLCIYERIGIVVPQIIIIIATDFAPPQVFIKETKDYVIPAIEFVKNWYANNK